MKVWTQDGYAVLNFGEACIQSMAHGTYGIYIRGTPESSGQTAGEYEDKQRAKGVLYEAMDAYKRDEKVFYMPQE